MLARFRDAFARRSRGVHRSSAPRVVAPKSSGADGNGAKNERLPTVAP
jgi:hypothetical protein